MLLKQLSEWESQVHLASESLHPLLISTLLPASTILFAVLLDFLATIQHPALFQKTLNWLASPFRNFITLDDLLEPVGPVIKVSRLKIRVLSVLAGVSLVGWLGCLAFGVYLNEIPYAVRCLVFSICWFYVFLRLAMRPPVTTPYLLVAFGLTYVYFSLVDFGNHLSSADSRKLAIVDFLSMQIPAIFAWVAGTLPLKAYTPSARVAGPNDIPSDTLCCPEDNVNLWNWSGFTFVQPILDLADKKTLNGEDIWSLSPFFKHKNIFTKFLGYRYGHPSHSLLRFLLVSNSLDLILDVALELWSAVAGFIPPYALQEILAALSSGTQDAANRAYFWTLMTFFAHISFAQVDLFQSWHTRRCYERTRGQMFCMLHYKSLKRQQLGGRVNKDGEPGSADLGKIVNLMQGDTYAVAQRFWEFSGIFVAPVRITIALVFLYRVLGWSGLSGVVVVLVAFTVNYPLAMYDVSITRETWKAKDTRMNFVNELLQNIRFLKFYGWEYSWARKAHDARETELGLRVKRNFVDIAISFIWVWMPSATALASFLCYTVIAGERLTVSKAFTSIALFSQLQGPMVAFPGQIFAMLHAYVSMQRIEEFLQEDEVPDWASTLSTPVEGHRSGSRENHSISIGFEEASFQWPGSTNSDTSGFQLGPLDVRFPSGQLSIVSGATGSGKSAFLAALLGEMQCIGGQVLIDKTGHQVAFCAQNPWLEHATIRDNILFGSPFDQDRYDAVLDYCALRPDLRILDAEDMTEIGEKGITLSGGQRARVALARAMYSHSKVILLDDPLAAVDMHTAQHLVDHCLAGKLARGRTIILVTHHLALCLPIASYVLEIQKGKTLYQGTIPDLESQGLLSKIIEAEEEPFPEPEASAVSPTNDADNLKGSETEDIPLPKPSKSGVLIEEETRAEGRVSVQTYITYFKSGGIAPWILVFATQLTIRAINVLYQVFLARWGEAYEDEDAPAFAVLTALRNPWENLPPPDRDVRPWLVIFLIISACGALVLLAHLAIGYYISIQTSRSLFNALLKRLTRAPARFFDTTPIGRILNRFTTDINTIDDVLQRSAGGCLLGSLNFVVSFGVILYVIPSFAPVALFIAWLYVRLAPSYIRASRDLRRLESVSLSPAFAGFDELLRGIVHIRAFGMENRYQDRFYGRVDKFQSFDHVYWLVNGWLRWRYDCLGSVVVFAATIFALWSGVRDGSAAVVIVQAGIFAEASRQLVKVAAQLELDFNSVERVTEYLEVPQEAPAVIEERRVPAYWPSSSGNIMVEDLVVKYAPHLPPVLHKLSFVVYPSEKIGVVGRTGSGKSTLAMSFLRMIEPEEGKIYIDGINICKIGLEELRNRITIVSQDVSLFTGTIRSNLDPLGRSTAKECIEVLERCHLLPLLNHTPTPEEPTPLDKRISQNSLSAGEKQLISIARAILRRTNIIIMDEATSQVDSSLDDQIQRTIRQELAGVIVITIAHRLKTVMDYDRILVLDQGKIVEFDSPANLLDIRGGVFREMCRKSADWPLFLRMVGKNVDKSREGS